MTGKESERFGEDWYLKRTSRNHFWIGGKEGQEAIGKMDIAVAGLGGMGSQIAELLVRAGVRKLRIADPDDIDVSNINRQVIANSNTIGRFKREALEEKLLQIAPETQIRSFLGVTEANISEFIEGVDAVVDEIDVFPLQAHLYLHQAARKSNLPVYSAYVVGMGTHFYKFRGNEYTFESFLGPISDEMLSNPTAELLLAKFGFPLPNYLQGPKKMKYLEEISSGSIPIFGPATLLGQSLVATRLLVDLLGTKHVPFAKPTPVMPEFLVLDPIDCIFRTETLGSL